MLGRSGKTPADRTHFVQHTQVPIDGNFDIDHPTPWLRCAVLTQRWRMVDGKQLYNAEADPSQTRDIASANAAVVSKLRAAYEKWFADVTRNLSEPPPCVLGARQQNPSRLTCYDWHGPKWMAWQRDAAKLSEVNGFWAVEFEQPGLYSITLSQQPEEAPCPIRATEARIRIGDLERKVPIGNGAEAATFELPLKTGPTRIQTWFTESRGAYFLYANRLRA